MRIIYKFIIIILIIIAVLSVGLFNINNRIFVHNANAYYLITQYTDKHMDLIIKEVELNRHLQSLSLKTYDTYGSKENLTLLIDIDNFKADQFSNDLTSLASQINDEKNKEIFWYPPKNRLYLVILVLTLVNAVLGIFAVASERKERRS